MIRRCTVDGSGWLLIQQVDHARLSAELAQYWRTVAEFGSTEDRDDLLAAIQHHDDGWSQWDAQLHCSPDTGQPLAFNEMSSADSNSIWTRSIQIAESMGPLTAYIVARHFLRMRVAGVSDDSSGSTAAFVRRFESECQRWLGEWADRRGDARPNREFAEQAVDFLQFFDALSLYICLGRIESSVQLTQPLGPPINVSQQSDWGYSISPRPLTVAQVKSAVHVLQIPVGAYGSAKQLKQATSHRDLIWTVQSIE